VPLTEEQIKHKLKNNQCRMSGVRSVGLETQWYVDLQEVIENHTGDLPAAKRRLFAERLALAQSYRSFIALQNQADFLQTQQTAALAKKVDELRTDVCKYRDLARANAASCDVNERLFATTVGHSIEDAIVAAEVVLLGLQANAGAFAVLDGEAWPQKLENTLRSLREAAQQRVTRSHTTSPRTWRSLARRALAAVLLELSGLGQAWYCDHPEMKARFTLRKTRKPTATRTRTPQAEAPAARAQASEAEQAA
jgi:hypothetical protein